MERKGSEAGYEKRWEERKACLKISRRRRHLRNGKDSAISELWLNA